MSYVYRYEYTGAQQTFTAPETGNYRLRVWGAEGGGPAYPYNSSFENNEDNGGVGGNGGYSEGFISLTQGDILYIYVGGHGYHGWGQLIPGGWNGGGTSYGSSQGEPGSSGGGATDIRMGGSSLSNRIIVAGGGGGGGEDIIDYGGAGGGSTGGIGNQGSTGGSQTTGGSNGGELGQGANITLADGGAGGGGYYGGGKGSSTDTSSTDNGGGAGGSGYISATLISGSMTSGDENITSPEGSIETGHAGHGCAIIEIVDIDKILDGNGTQSSPYLVKSIDDLAAMRNANKAGDNFSGKYFKQVCDIDMTEYLGNTSNGWEEICSEDISARWFSAALYDGDYNTVSGLWSSNTNVKSTSLFGHVGDRNSNNKVMIKNLNIVIDNKGIKAKFESASIASEVYSNVYISNIRVSGGNISSINSGTSASCSSSGGIVGRTSFFGGTGSIENCSCTCNVSNKDGNAGGIAGTYSKNIKYCYYSGYVDTKRNAGGIVGEQADDSVKPIMQYCCSHGFVTNHNTSSYVGGIAGRSMASTTSCYSDSALSGSGIIGGIIGCIDTGSNTDPSLYNSYFAGSITSGYSVVGERKTQTDRSITFTNVYYSSNNTQSPLGTLSGSGTSSGTPTSVAKSNFTNGKLTDLVMLYSAGFSAVYGKNPYLDSIPDDLPKELIYHGDYDRLNLPKGTYLIECYGGAGGIVVDETTSSPADDIDISGKGGYAAGVISLNNLTTFYTYVGGKGTDLVNGQPELVSGGWNGGGDVMMYGSSGGGATDIRTVSGDWDNFESLKSRIIVAAGGAGNGHYNTYIGGNGGGLIGLDGDHADSPEDYGHGGTQTSGGDGKNCGTFGVGGTSVTSPDSTTNAGGGGGGGYYGGGSGYNGSTDTSGGGGSSFISGHPGCNAIAESSTSSSITHTGQPIHYSGHKFGPTKMISGYNSGNGKIRITYINNNDSSTPIKIYKDLYKIKGIVLEMSDADVLLGNKIKLFSNGCIAVDSLEEDATMTSSVRYMSNSLLKVKKLKETYTRVF